MKREGDRKRRRWDSDEGRSMGRREWERRSGASVWEKSGGKGQGAGD